MIEIAAWVALAPLLAACLYLAALTLMALLPGRRRPRPAGERRRFALLIPAHDEAAALPALLGSIARLDYPPDLITVAVVADNCSDDTVAVAGAAGATVLVREDPDRSGKGYALAHGIERLRDGDYDALVCVDADCTLSPEALAVFDDHLAQGDDAVQAWYTMDHGASATGVLREQLLGLVHLLRPLALARVGASAGLKGSGMCFSRRLVEELGWTSVGLAEDAEQHTRLLLAGHRVAFAPGAVVRGAAPARLTDAAGQHRRWEAGRLAAARAGAPRLLALALRQRSPVALLAAVELLVPPVSVVALGLAVVAAGGAVFGLTGVTLAAIGGVALLACYLCAGALLMRTPPLRLARALAALPMFVAWKLLQYARSVVAAPRRWQPTRRDPVLAPREPPA